MAIQRRVVLAGVTFFLAAATGHIMQNGDRIVAWISAGPAPEPAAATVSEASIVPLSADTESVPPFDTSRSLPDFPGGAPARLASYSRHEPPADSVSRTRSAADDVYSAFGYSCAARSLTVSPSAGEGRVTVVLALPCAPGALAHLSYMGAEFTVTLDQMGLWHGDVPAPLRAAPVVANVSGGDPLRAVAAADPGARAWHVLSWDAGIGLSVIGPKAGETVVPGADSAEGRRAIFVPATLADGRSALGIEAEVDSSTCGRDLIARLTVADGTAQDIRLAMPPCDGAGGFVQIEVPLPEGRIDLARGDLTDSPPIEN